ncbi:MAG TPA: alcohol dehydrogenase catalytic domain-containing protein [Planctomycetota bacterium]|nr:alcohol dehydrogenase catalytic domain-containing protein [Planctomycetota bacterium]
MKALVYTAPHKVESQVTVDPAPKPGEVLVRVRAAGVCGSDLLGFLGKSKKRIPPLILGHEIGGEVAALGSGVTDLRQGQRVGVMPLITCGTCVYCRRGRNSVCEKRVLLGMNVAGGFAEYTVAPRACIYPVSESMSYLQASMIECLATPLNLFENHVRGPVETAAIFGAGTQGILAMQMAKSRGATTIFVIDVQPARLAVVERLGARPIHAKAENPVDAVLRATHGQGCDVVVDAAGYTPARQQGLKITARGGVLAFVGLSDPATELDVMDIINREIEIHGIYGYAPADYQKALALVAGSVVDVSTWVREFPLGEGQSVLEQLTSQPGDLVKASFVP